MRRWEKGERESLLDSVLPAVLLPFLWYDSSGEESENLGGDEGKGMARFADTARFASFDYDAACRLLTGDETTQLLLTQAWWTLLNRCNDDLFDYARRYKEKMEQSNPP